MWVFASALLHCSVCMHVCVCCDPVLLTIHGAQTQATIHTIILTKRRTAQEQYNDKSEWNERVYLQAIAKWMNFIHTESESTREHIREVRIGSLPCLKFFPRYYTLVSCFAVALILPHFYSTVVRFFPFDKSSFHFVSLTLSPCMFFFCFFFLCLFSLLFHFIRWNVAIFSIFCGIFARNARLFLLLPLFLSIPLLMALISFCEHISVCTFVSVFISSQPNDEPALSTVDV